MTVMPRIGNTRTIADIEFVIDAPGLGGEKTSWLSHGVECSGDRHRFSGQAYSFSFEVLHLRLDASARSRWHVVIVSELWRFEGPRPNRAAPGHSALFGAKRRMW